MTTWASGRSLEHSKWTPGFRKSRNVTNTTTTRSATTWTLHFFVYTLRILGNIPLFIRRFVPKPLRTPCPLCLYLVWRHCCKLYYMSLHIRCVLDYYKGGDKSLARPGRKQCFCQNGVEFLRRLALQKKKLLDYYKGADKSLARPERKQFKVSFRMAWISFGALPCRKKKFLDYYKGADKSLARPGRIQGFCQNVVDFLRCLVL